MECAYEYRPPEVNGWSVLDTAKGHGSTYDGSCSQCERMDQPLPFPDNRVKGALVERDLRHWAGFSRQHEGCNSHRQRTGYPRVVEYSLEGEVAIV